MGKNVFVIILEGIIVYIIIMVMGMVCKVFYIDFLIVEILEYVQIGLCVFYDYLLLEYYQVVGKVYEIFYWDCSNCFCFICGILLVQKEFIMKKCLNCGREIYLVILIVILVLVCKEDFLLLVYVCNFKGIFNSLVVGFFEIGEILEECVVREVKEEIGFDVKNICYFGSQFWFYLSGLMVGFIVDYVGGDIYL